MGLVLLQRFATLLVVFGIIVGVMEFILFTPSMVDKTEIVGRTENVEGDATVGVNEQADVLLTGFKYLSSEGDQPQWEMQADKARGFREDGRFDAQTVKVKVFSKNGNEFRVLSDRATFHTDVSDLELIGNVRIYTDDNYEFSTAQAFYSASSRDFFTDERVYVKGPLNEPNPMMVNGAGFRSNIDKKTFEFKRKVKLEKQEVVQGENVYPVLGTANKAIGIRDKGVVRFQGDVLFEQGPFQLKSNKGTFYYRESASLPVKKNANSNYTKPQGNTESLTYKLKYVVAYDDVWIKERIYRKGQAQPLIRQARCDRAEFKVQDDKVLLTGNPHLTQGKDRLSGKRMLLYRGKELVEIDSVAAKIHLNENELRKNEDAILWGDE